MIFLFIFSPTIFPSNITIILSDKDNTSSSSTEATRIAAEEAKKAEEEALKKAEEEAKLNEEVSNIIIHVDPDPVVVDRD